MAVELSRRFFVFGTAAAIAAAAVPTKVGALTRITPITPVPALNKFKRRLIWDFQAYNDGGFGLVSLYRGNECIHRVGLAQYGSYRWVPFLDLGRDLAGIHIRDDEVFRLSIESQDNGPSLGSIDLMCEDWIDDGDPVRVLERHQFPQRGPAQLVALDPKDQERLERFRVLTDYSRTSARQVTVEA